MRRLLPLLLLLAGCAHHAKLYRAPDNSAVIQAGHELRAKITKATDTAGSAQAAVARVAQHSSEQDKLITDDAKKIADLLRVTPPELRDAVQALKTDNDALAEKQAEIDGEIAGAQKLQGDLSLQLNQDIPTAEQKLTTVDDAYFKNVQSITDRANAAEQGWAKDSATIVSMDVHSWLYKIAAALGLLAVAVVLLLHFTGRLALTAGQIASKIP